MKGRGSAAIEDRGHKVEQRLPGLDGLRAVACLLVFGVHFGQITALQGRWGPFDVARWLANGNTGVALFFALSGFLLSLPYWRVQRENQPLPAAGRFFARRAARILPAYFACLGALVIANRHWQEADAGLDILLHVLMLFNFREASTLSINPPFWTLAVEAQFYLLLPLLFVLLRGSRRAVALSALLLLGVAAYGAHLARLPAAGPAPAWVTYSLLAHLPHFLLGVVTGGLFDARRPPASRRGGVLDALLAAVLLLLIVILATPLDEVLQLPGGRYNLPFVPLLLCLLVVLVPVTRLGRLAFDSAPLRGIGRVSYGVYIYHLPVQHVTARLMTRESLNPAEHWLLFGAVSLGVTLLTAAASYLLVERPVLRATRRRLGRTAAPGVGDSR